MSTTIEELYQQRCRGEGQWPDLCEHLPTLRAFAEKCGHTCEVVEFGTRSGNSTCAFLAAKNVVTVMSCDINPHCFDCPEDAKARWVFKQADTSKLERIIQCEILFIDSLHAETQVRAELKHHVSVRRYIILHDTITWGTKADDGRDGPGINFALFPFLAEHSKTWRVCAHWNNCNGLTVLERISA